MNPAELPLYTAFEGQKCVANGDLATVVTQIKAILDATPRTSILIFDNADSRPAEIDFRGDLTQVLARLPASAALEPEAAAPESVAKAGRPRLGVTAREVTLLPRHWEWLGAQPGGASVALRKLVEEARRANADKDRLRAVQESVSRFMSALCGDLANYEEASRAFYRGEKLRFEAMIEDWPPDLSAHLQILAAQAGW